MLILILLISSDYARKYINIFYYHTSNCFHDKNVSWFLLFFHQQLNVESLLHAWVTSLQERLSSMVTLVTNYTQQQAEKIECLQQNLNEQNQFDEVISAFT